MIRFLIRAGIFLGTAAIGLLIAALLVPGVIVSLPGFVVAVVVFAVAQSLITPVAMKLTRKANQALIGGMGLVSTALALLVASLFQGGIELRGALAWVLGTLVVWAVTALGWWLLPLWLLKEKAQARRS